MGRLRWLLVATGSVAAVSPARAQGDIRLHVEAPARVVAGESAAIVLRLRNAGTRPQSLYLRGREVVYDLVVTDSGGTPSWQRLEGEIIPAIVQVRTLAPGEELVLTASWPAAPRGTPFPPGRYTLRAEMPTDGEPITSTAVTVEVVRPR